MKSLISWCPAIFRCKDSVLGCRTHPQNSTIDKYVMAAHSRRQGSVESYSAEQSRRVQSCYRNDIFREDEFTNPHSILPSLQRVLVERRENDRTVSIGKQQELYTSFKAALWSVCGLVIVEFVSSTASISVVVLAARRLSPRSDFQVTTTHHHHGSKERRDCVRRSSDGCARQISRFCSRNHTEH
jgi:hypothetical protein